MLVEAPRSRAVTRSTSGAGLVVPGPSTPPPPEDHQHQHHVVGAGKGDHAADQRPSATCTAGGAGSHGGGEDAFHCCYFAHTVCCFFVCATT